MADITEIEWTDKTFSPWTGCTKVSAACDHCYAEGWSKRSGHVKWGPKGDRRRTSPGYWGNARKWDRSAYESGSRIRVFPSLCDPFDNHKSISAGLRSDFWDLIRETPNLTWQLLTKRPQNVVKMLPPDWGSGWDNVWIGTTIENQSEADRRIPHLFGFDVSTRFLSYEPALGPLDLGWPSSIYPDGPPRCCNGQDCGCMGMPTDPPMAYRIDLLICGGESGNGARPMNPDWARSVRDQCREFRVNFFMKQMGGSRKPFPPIPDDLNIQEMPEW